MSRRFVERDPILKQLEGWYDTGAYKFKISCKFNDILRCSEFNGKTRHFISCFRALEDRVGAYGGVGGVHHIQPLLRCYDKNWAIAYTPDQHGNFMGRSWIHLLPTGAVEVGYVYGNRLTVDNIIRIIMNYNGLNCLRAYGDTYLPESG